MKKNLIFKKSMQYIPAIIAAFSLSSTAHADNEEKQQAENLNPILENGNLSDEISKAIAAAFADKKNGKIISKVIVSGKSIVIGPDGKKKEVELDEDTLKKLGNLNDMIFKPLVDDEKFSEQLSSALLKALQESTPSYKSKTSITVMGNGIIIGPDGVKRTLNLDNSDILKQLKGLKKKLSVKQLDDGTGKLQFYLQQTSDKINPSITSDPLSSNTEALNRISKQLEIQTQLLQKLLERSEKAK